MQEASEYLELSLSGKWASIARKWLEKNAPCSVEDYIVGVARHMPTHIASRDGRLSQVQLAKQAMGRLKVAIVNGMIQAPATSRSQKGYAERVRQDALRNGYVIRTHYPDIKHIGGIISGLVAQGLLVYDSKNRYILNGNTEQEKQ